MIQYNNLQLHCFQDFSYYFLNIGLLWDIVRPTIHSDDLECLCCGISLTCCPFSWIKLNRGLEEKFLWALVTGKLEQQMTGSIPKSYRTCAIELELHLNVKVSNFWEKMVSARTNWLHSILVDQTYYIYGKSVKIPKVRKPWSWILIAMWEFSYLINRAGSLNFLWATIVILEDAFLSNMTSVPWSWCILGLWDDQQGGSQRATELRSSSWTSKDCVFRQKDVRLSKIIDMKLASRKTLGSPAPSNLLSLKEF